MDINLLIEKLQLQPHPEGGFYKETYRANEHISADALPGRYQSERSFSTAIYYLLTEDTCSNLHKVETDELFHFYCGDPVSMLMLNADGSSEEIVIGNEILAEQHPQHLVTRGTWQGSSLLPGGSFALLGATVAPGFDFSDFTLGEFETLSKAYPNQIERIRQLTP